MTRDDRAICGRFSAPSDVAGKGKGCESGQAPPVPTASEVPAILRAVRGTLDRDCGIAAVAPLADDGHQSRRARRVHPPGAVAKARDVQDESVLLDGMQPFKANRHGSPVAWPTVAWIALRKQHS